MWYAKIEPIMHLLDLVVVVVRQFFGKIYIYFGSYVGESIVEDLALVLQSCYILCPISDDLSELLPLMGGFVIYCLMKWFILLPHN